jgi:tol-pal system protein YbgF
MRLLLLVSFVLSFAGVATAQDRTQSLADIRAELTRLAGDIAALRTELASTGNQGGTVPGTVLDRVGAMEAEMARLTARTEELDIKINRVIADGTNRIGDLEFRLVELEGGDISKLPTIMPLGGEAVPGGGPAPVLPTEVPAGGAELAVGEKTDFENAKAKYDAGDFQGAADALASFNQNYPGSPLGPDAMLMRGDALGQLSQPKEAALAYLDAFTVNEAGPKAPTALLKLGKALDQIGQRPDACLMLREVIARFPTAPEATEAQGAIATMACG